MREDHCHYDEEHNFGFIDTIVGGTIPNQFVPAVEKGCKELLERGALAGYRIQDVAAEVWFGKYHDVDSSEAAFKTAARIAFKNGILAARPVLLEPIVHIEITVPSKFYGAISGDLNTRRARIENQDSLPGDLAVIIGIAPLAEMMRYKATLDSITAGAGFYTMEFSHYDQVPAMVQQQIVKSAKVAADEEE
jgi:elongation factor G